MPKNQGFEKQMFDFFSGICYNTYRNKARCILWKT